MQQGYHVGYTGKGWAPGTYDSEYNPAGPKYNQLKNKPPYKAMNKINYAANFEAFLEEKKENQPFCFWLGTGEPHRPYEKGAWKKAGRKLSDAVVPPFYPDNKTIRGDLLDYANEVEWYDLHVGRAIETLRKQGLLDNTLVIVTSDHGMPFPRIKGQIYEEGVHVPFIAHWPKVIQPGRVIEDFINFPDVAPTLMEVAGLKPHEQMTGRSFLDLLKSDRSGWIDPSRDHVLLGKERHDIGRANEDGTDLGYPVRAIRTKDFLYVYNYKPERWPVGNPEYGLRNCDNSPTKSFLTSIPKDSPDYTYYELSFGKRPPEELYRIDKDPHCMENLAGNPEYKAVREGLRKQMEQQLTEQGDPRVLGHGDIFDKYPYMSPKRKDFDYSKKQKVGQ